MPAQTVWGLDIGESCIKAVKMARVRSNLQIIRVDMISIGVPGGEAASVDRETMLIAALEEFVRRHDPSDSRVIASIQGRSTFCKLITLPPVEQKRIPEIVRFEVKQQIPFPIEDIVWDYVLCKQDFVPGEEIEVNLVAIRKEIIENFVETFARAGIRLDGLQATPLALFNLAKYELMPEGNVVIIDVGADLTDLVIVEGDRFWPRTLGIAGKHVTKALEDKFEIPHDEAEALKLNAADSKHHQKIFSVVKPVLKDLVTEIHRTIGYYKSLSKDVAFDKIIFLGNATKLAGFEKFFGENLPYEIEVIQGLQRVRVSKRVNLKALKEYLPGFSVAIGLAIQGLREGQCQVSLLPDEISGKMRPGKMMGMAAALLSLVLAIPTGLVIANVGVAASERKEAPFAENPIKKILDVQNIAKSHKQALADISEMRKIQENTRQRYLKPYDTVDLPMYVLQAVDKLLPRGAGEEIIKNKGDKQEIYLDETDKIYLIKVDYENILVVPKSTGRKGAVQPQPRREIKVEIVCIVKNRGDIAETKDYVNSAFVDKLNEHWLSASRAHLLLKKNYENEIKELFNKWQGGILKKILNKNERDELKAKLSLHYILQDSFREKMKYKGTYEYYDLLVEEIREHENQPAYLRGWYVTPSFWDGGSGEEETGAEEYVVYKLIWRINPAAVLPG